jgi:hypothetical protein
VTKFPEIFDALASDFDPAEVKSRPQSGRQLYYITARTAMNRLDYVLGPENWWDRYTPHENSVLCRLTIRLPDGSILSKCDAGGYAGMSDSGDDDKSGYSDAFKRACVKFGVARYLYRDGVPSYIPQDAPPAEAAAAAQDRSQARQERPPARGRPDAPAARSNGRGRTPDGAPDRAAVNEQFPARAETWSQFIAARLRQANGDWLREMTRGGVAPDVRQEHRELTNEPRTVNALCTRLVELGKLDAATIAKGKDPAKRDPEKARDAVRWFFDSSPKAIKSGVEKYLTKKLVEGRAKLGMPDPDARESVKAEAVKAGSGAPPPGKGDAYEGEIEEALSN